MNEEKRKPGSTEEEKEKVKEEIKVPSKGACLPVGRDQPLVEKEKPAEEKPAADEKEKADQPLAEKAGEEKKAEAPKKEAVKAKAEESKGKKRKKINLMSQKEIEEKLNSVKEKMGNLKSRYARQLLKQKDILSK
jgi:hypothetical protein